MIGKKLGFLTSTNATSSTDSDFHCAMKGEYERNDAVVCKMNVRWWCGERMLCHSIQEAHRFALSVLRTQISFPIV